MKALRRFLVRLSNSTVRRRDDTRLRDEVEEHLALQTAENVRAGMPADEARRLAVLKFGPVEAMKDDYRDQQRLPFLEHLRRDVRDALRQLRKAPAFAVTATLSFAVGIGANTAIFTVVDRVLLRPLPVSNPHELVFVTDARPRPRYSYPFYAALRDTSALNGVAAHFVLPLNARMDDRVGRLRGELVSGNYFSVVGAGVQIGRALTPDDDRTPGAHATVVIADRVWRRDFGADPSVLGRAVRLNNYSFTIVGVAAKGFTGVDVGVPTDVWLPLMMQKEVGRDLLMQTRTNWLEMIGRLPTGVTTERAGADLAADLERRADATSAFRGRRLLLLPADKGNSSVRAERGTALKVLLVLTGLALALACVNVASLLVVRSAGREKEIAVRLALGAGRATLIRQFLTETLVLAAIGGAAGLLVAPWAAGLLVASQPDVLDIDTHIDMRVFLFGLSAAVLTALLVGLAPVLTSSKIRIAQAFGQPAGTIRGTHRRLTLHDLIVTCQIAASLVMLIGAALFVQSLRNLRSIDPGFRADNLLLISVDPGAAGYDAVRRETYWRDTIDRLRQVHGVQSVSVAGTVPLAQGRQRQPVHNPSSGEVAEIDTNYIGPQYFRTLGIPVMRGREFGEQDAKTSRRVVIVNERLAQMLWPAQDAVGKGVRIGSRDNPLSEVVAVVQDAKYRELRDEAVPMLYVPLLQITSSDVMTLHIRTAGNPMELIGPIRHEMRVLDASLPLAHVTTLDDRLNASFAQTRQAAALTSGFGVVALLLSGLGVYGVTALAVSRRTRDIGIRRALGASPRHIAGVIGRQGVMVAIVGIGLGVAGSFAFGRIAGALLYGIAATDRSTFAAMGALLAAVSLAAIVIPARAATRLDPIAAIRYE